MPSFSVYALVEADLAAVIVHRRTETGFVREVYEGLDAVIALPEVDTFLTLSEIYDTVDFAGGTGEPAA